MRSDSARGLVLNSIPIGLWSLGERFLMRSGTAHALICHT